MGFRGKTGLAGHLLSCGCRELGTDGEPVRGPPLKSSQVQGQRPRHVWPADWRRRSNDRLGPGRTPLSLCSVKRATPGAPSFLSFTWPLQGSGTFLVPQPLLPPSISLTPLGQVSWQSISMPILLGRLANRQPVPRSRPCSLETKI